MTETPKPVPYFLKAMGRKPIPNTVNLPGGRYRLAQVFKHDFFAATGLYQRQDGHRVVVKFGRQADILGLPSQWIGRWLTNREAKIYQSLHGTVGIPAFAGCDGHFSFAHDYVEGQPLRKSDQVTDQFFAQLTTLIDTIHARGLAYVDLEKCENIILGQDGRPYLIDFQISWPVPSESWLPARQASANRESKIEKRWTTPTRYLLKLLQHMDRYHLLKHQRRLRPDQLSQEQLDAFEPPFYIRLHRALVKPLQKLRRTVLNKLDPQHVSSSR